ncbi:MAG: MOSC N-terminal beta barrel domain-containing protein [Synechococcales cyanobacterium T60_A2020_003]|nr:MOSC N-terminal beta barrel domain-containing protein [Synechococcales cyanobacterium T60_A2020_003]
MKSEHPVVSSITIYPVKSLDGVNVPHRSLLNQAGLTGDRTFAIVDNEGQFVNGKRNAKIHSIRSTFDLEAWTISLSIHGTEAVDTFHLEGDRTALEQWLSDYFHQSVHLIQKPEGFPDDTNSPGPTIISTATLEAIAAWYPNLSVDDIRRRFRSNIEIAGTPAFWEDQLFSNTDTGVEFQIGDTHLLGVNPCQRCVVVTRDPDTGESFPEFQKIFVANRKETLPDWAERSRFNHFFRVAVNTRISSSTPALDIKVGDSLSRR